MDTERNTILIVDDMEVNRAVLREIFADSYEILEAADGQEALKQIEVQKNTIAAILLDIVMPVMDGFAVLEQLCNTDFMQEVPVFLITAETSDDAMRRGYDLGVADVIFKPIVPYFVERRINNIIELYRARASLHHRVVVQERALDKKNQEIHSLNYAMIEMLATAIEFRDCESGQHIRRIYDLTLMFLRESDFGAELTDNQIKQIAIAAIMHDVGKIAIPDQILNKPGRLTSAEYEIMKEHTVKGAELINQIPQMKSQPVYQYAYDICLHHHERWDGNGYPDGLKGDEISVWSQVVSLADVYDALTSARVYKKAYSHEKAVEMIQNGECGVFNPALLKSFLSLAEKIKTRLSAQNNDTQQRGAESAIQIPMPDPGLSREEQRAFLSRVPGGIFKYAADDKEILVFFNQGILDLYGCTEDEFIALTGNSFMGMVHPDDLERVEREIHEQIQHGPVDRVEYRIIRKDGEIRWLEDRGRLVTDETGRDWFYVVVLDITEKKRLEEKLLRSEEQYRILTALGGDIVFDIDCRNGSVEVGGNFAGQFGRPPACRDFLRYLDKNTCRIERNQLYYLDTWSNTYKLDKYEEESEIINGNGEKIWCRCQYARLHADDGSVYRVLGRLTNTHAQKIRELDYRKRAELDALTGIYNRQMCKKITDSVLAGNAAPGSCLLAIVDIDNFKEINDTYGHPFGDLVLQQIASVFPSTLENTVFSRLGGDEYALLITDLQDVEQALRDLGHLSETIVKDFRENNSPPMEITVSVGAALNAPDDDFAKLYKKADIALYQAKNDGKNTVRLYQKNTPS